MTGRRRASGEGAVYWDGTRNRWVGQVWIDGRRRKVSATTEKDAAAKIGKLLHGDPTERHVDRRGRVAGLLVDWQALGLANRDRAPATVEAHAWAAAIWTARLGKVRLVELDVLKVERALAAMAADGLSRASLVKARSTLRQALAWGQRRNLVAFNPAAVAELPVAAAGPKEKNTLSAAERDRLLEALEGKEWRAMFGLMVRVGLRPGEAAGMCADAVDLDTDPPNVTVFRAVHLEKGRPVLVEELKTAGARRRLAIPADVSDMLRPLLSRDGLLFTTPKGGPVWPSTVRAELADACARAKVRNVSPNELRHTAATLLSDGGLAPHLIADLLGHRSTRMVDATYRHRPSLIRGAD